MYLDRVNWADGWETVLEPLGLMFSTVIINAEPLQKKWAREHGIGDSEEYKAQEIVLAQTIAFKPDVLWYDHHDIELLKALREKVSSIRLVLGWIGSAISSYSRFEGVDLVLSCAPESVIKLRDKGIESQHFNHIFDPRVLDAIQNIPKQFSVSFIGQIIRRAEFHWEREKVLLGLLKRGVDLKIFSSTAKIRHASLLRARAKIIVYQTFQKLSHFGMSLNNLEKLPWIGPAAGWSEPPILPCEPKLLRVTYPAVFGMDMYRVIKRSKVSLNIHADSSPTHASNMRLFEATGVGTCLLTDWKSNLNDLFKDGTEVLSYKSAEECVEKVMWLLDHPSEAHAIALAGQKRCLSEHTFQARTPELLRIIEAQLR